MTLRVSAPNEVTATRIGGEAGTREAPAAEGPSFGGVLEETFRAANAKEIDAVEKANALAAGKLDDLHGTMITMKEAEISLKLVGSVRNKLIDAFHELWRTSV